MGRRCTSDSIMEYIYEWRIASEKASDNEFFAYPTIRQTFTRRGNLSGDPRTDSINELNTTVIAPLIAVLSLELQVPPSLSRHPTANKTDIVRLFSNRSQMTSKYGKPCIRLADWNLNWPIRVQQAGKTLLSWRHCVLTGRKHWIEAMRQLGPSEFIECLSPVKGCY